MLQMNAFAQVDDNDNSKSQNEVTLFGITISGKEDAKFNLEDTEGSPYYNQVFINGKILDLLDNKLTSVDIRYNIFNQQMEVIFQKEIKSLVKSDQYLCFIGDEKFIYFKDVKNQNEGSYYKILVDNLNASLLVEYTCKFYPEEKPKTSLEKGKKAKFKTTESYYIKFDDRLVKVVSNKNKMIEQFPKNKDLIKKYINDNKIDLNSEEDLVKLINYYNQQQ